MEISKMSFLIVDDDAMTLNKLEQDLRSIGVKGTISKAVNGDEAFDVYSSIISKNGVVDFVICDMVMPVSSGLDFLIRFRGELDKERKIPFLMLTSKSDKMVVLKCIQAGVTQYLLKPWNEQLLMQKVVECVGKHL